MKKTYGALLSFLVLCVSIVFISAVDFDTSVQPVSDTAGIITVAPEDALVVDVPAEAVAAGAALRPFSITDYGAHAVYADLTTTPVPTPTAEPTPEMQSKNEPAKTDSDEKAEATPKPKATATPKPKATATPKPKESSKAKATATPKPSATTTTVKGAAPAAKSGRFSKEDITLAAKLIYAEGRTQTTEGYEAMANVLLNRCMSRKFPDTVEENVYREGQFSVIKYSWFEGLKPSKKALHAADRIFRENKRVLPASVMYFKSAKLPQKWGKRVYYDTISGNMYYK